MFIQVIFFHLRLNIEFGENIKHKMLCKCIMNAISFLLDKSRSTLQQAKKNKIYL